MKKEALAVVLSATALSLIGLVFIYSASSYGAELQTGDAFFYVKKQAAAFAVGVFAMLAARYTDIGRIKKYKYVFLVLSLLLLAAVFIPSAGVESYGAKRWLDLGFFTVQPSEYSKFLLVMFISAYMAERDMTKIKYAAAVLASGFAACVLIMLEPNMSVTVCVGAVMILMLFVGGAKGKFFAALSVPAAAALPVLIFSEPYRLRRLVAFLNPWENPQAEGYQLIQSYYALGSGGWFGVGIGNSRQKYLFLPFAESDFILSIIGEETGWTGCVLLAALFGVYIFYGVKIAIRADTRFKSYLAFGITAVVAVQSAINFAVVSGTIPPTGLPLPFVSAGGSSLVAFLLATGLLAACGSSDGNRIAEKGRRLTEFRAYPPRP